MNNNNPPESAKSHNIHPERDEAGTLDSRKQRQVQLTQINNKLKSQHSNDGFVQAKHDINKALAENKLILNQRFVLESTIGAGGMGTVYKAQDLRKVEARDTNSYVAIKVLSGDFKQHPDAFIALQREASRSSHLAHPNIVTVYDFDRDGDTVYMTMELLQGRDLYSLISEQKQGSMPKAEALKIVRDYCEALSYAHKKGVIHCDLKPANIFVTPEGTKVLDFGIARLAMQNHDHFDAGKMGAFTPAYASLEMFNRDAPDPRDDVFAAAVIAYELLSGKHPYGGISAPTALALNKQPQPIDGLTKKEWRALQGALQLNKPDRTKSIQEFLDGLVKKQKVSLVKVIIASTLVVLGAVTYLTFWGTDELNKKIELTLKQAQSCLESRDFSCAIRNAEIVLSFEPEHSQAHKILMESKSRQGQLEKQQQVERLLEKAEQCFTQNNLKCAKESAQEILRISGEHPQAIALLTDIESRTAEQEKRYLGHLEASEKCFSQKSYACVMSEADAALSVFPGDETALNLKQKAQFELEQHQLAMAKAKQIVNDGEQCFKKFDYSCAIAKAEAALAFVPNYAPANKLKQNAKKAIDDAKKAITIQ